VFGDEAQLRVVARNEGTLGRGVCAEIEFPALTGTT
jgi:hypothetical protein